MNFQLCEVFAPISPMWQILPLSPPTSTASNHQISPCSTIILTSALCNRMVLPLSPAPTCQVSAEHSHPQVFHPILLPSQALSLRSRALSVPFLHDPALHLRNDNEDVKKPWQRRWERASLPILKIWSACKDRWQKMPWWKPSRPGSTIRNTRYSTVFIL